MAEIHQEAQVVPSTGSTQSCTVEIIPRRLKMHNVSESELDALASGSTSINLTFFGICLGAAISFGIVLRTTTLEPFSKAVFEALFFSSLVMGAYFGVFGVKDHRASKKRLSDIKGGRILNSN
jgi:hypothetical protein